MIHNTGPLAQTIYPKLIFSNIRNKWVMNVGHQKTDESYRVLGDAKRDLE